MRVFVKEWGREIYFDTIDEVLYGIRNDRIKEKIKEAHYSCIPITKAAAFVVRRAHKGYIIGVYRLHEQIPVYPLYEAPKLSKLKIIEETSML